MKKFWAVVLSSAALKSADIKHVKIIDVIEQETEGPIEKSCRHDLIRLGVKCTDKATKITTVSASIRLEDDKYVLVTCTKCKAPLKGARADAEFIKDKVRLRWYSPINNDLAGDQVFLVKEVK